MKTSLPESILTLNPTPKDPHFIFILNSIECLRQSGVKENNSDRQTHRQAHVHACTHIHTHTQSPNRKFMHKRQQEKKMEDLPELEWVQLNVAKAIGREGGTTLKEEAKTRGRVVGDMKTKNKTF